MDVFKCFQMFSNVKNTVSAKKVVLLTEFWQKAASILVLTPAKASINYNYYFK